MRDWEPIWGRVLRIAFCSFCFIRYVSFFFFFAFMVVGGGNKKGRTGADIMTKKNSGSAPNASASTSHTSKSSKSSPSAPRPAPAPSYSPRPCPTSSLADRLPTLFPPPPPPHEATRLPPPPKAAQHDHEAHLPLILLLPRHKTSPSPKPLFPSTASAAC